MRYILSFLCLFVFARARTIYKVYETGQCLSPASPITEVSKCQQQSQAIGWPDDSATSVSFSSYLPTGCILKTATDDLRVYAKDSALDCSSDYKCLCEITAEDCAPGLNRAACLCSDNVCTRETGLVCSSGSCSHAPECLEGLNDDVCWCGSALDCTPLSGLKCSSGSCSHAEICPNRVGTVSNVETCRCGSTDCSSVIGSYCHSESSTCRAACPGGTYVSHLLQCEPCDKKGYYCPSGSTQSSSSFKCPAGRFGDISGLKSADECKRCAAGRYSIIPGITSGDHCTGRCSAGKWSSEVGLSSDELCIGRCPAGTFSHEMGLVSGTQCLGRCSAGKWSSGTGLTSDDQCSLCSAGKWSSEIGLTLDDLCLGRCPAGTYSDKTGLISSEQCKVCASNKYQDEIGKTVCKGCPDNKIIVDTATPSKHDSVDDCEIVVPVCDASEYLEDNQCKSCSESFTCDGTVKLDCPPGFYCPGDGPAIACPMGRYGELKSQTNAETACTKCLPGTYQNVIGQTYCSRGCPRGKFGETKGAENEEMGCRDCPRGYMCASLSMNRPDHCPLGSYQDEIGQQLCKFCPLDTYSETIAATECVSCGSTKDGKPLRTTGLGANSQTQCEFVAKTCPTGQRPNIKEVCEACPKGFYGNQKGTRCILCPKGFSQSEPGQQTCDVCRSYRCKALYGSADSSERPPEMWEPAFHKIVHEIDSNPFPVEIVVVYGSLVLVIMIIIGSHRFCPECFKHGDLMFSGDHIVEDTHARRILETRLGAAFTLSLPFVVALIAVFIFTSENKIITNGLIPIATTEIASRAGLYKNIYITYKTESASKADDCSDIKIHTQLNCSSKQQLVSPFVCQINAECVINPPFGGQHDFSIEMADQWQSAIVNIVTDVWNHSQYNISTVIQPQYPLAGTLEVPSTIDYDVIRSKSHDHQEQEVEYGLQMTTRNKHFMTTEIGTEYGTHVTTLRFFSTETLFVRESKSKLGLITQIGTVLTLTLSAISGLRVAKLGIEKCIDKCYTKMFRIVPEDIHRRVTILEERNHIENERGQRHETNKKKTTEVEIHTDEVTGRKYTYNPVTRKSVWLTL